MRNNYLKKIPIMSLWKAILCFDLQQIILFPKWFQQLSWRSSQFIYVILHLLFSYYNLNPNLEKYIMPFKPHSLSHVQSSLIISTTCYSGLLQNHSYYYHNYMQNDDVEILPSFAVYIKSYTQNISKFHRTHEMFHLHPRSTWNLGAQHFS